MRNPTPSYISIILILQQVENWDKSNSRKPIMDPCKHEVTETVVKFQDLDLQTKSELISNRNVEELGKVSERTNLLEQQMGYVYDNMVELIHAKAQLRDIGDGLGKAMHELGKVDHVHTSTNLSLTILANTCLSIGDKLDSGINAVENEIFPAFASFGNACKVIKDEVRIASQTEHRHAMKRAELIKFLERGKNNMEEQQYTEKLEMFRCKLVRWMTESSHLRRKCTKRLVKLETKRCRELKTLLSSWFRIQAVTDSKTLKLSTQGCQTALNIDWDGDMNNILGPLQLKIKADRDIIFDGRNESSDDELKQNDPNSPPIDENTLSGDSGTGDFRAGSHDKRHVSGGGGRKKTTNKKT